NLYSTIFRYRFHISGVFLLLLLIILFLWFDKQDLKEWMNSSWDLSMQLLPLLFIGVLVAGFALGRPGKEALIPSSWIAYLVGGNSIWANFFASVTAALMYFATLTEVPILQGLIGAGMGKGPALSLLLAGPAVSLPSMLVLRQIFGWKKMLVYIALVVLFSTLFGFLFGLIV
ncbi:MAG: permease, partial [Thermoanaerobaculaceae bacterium]|nr:permease [Thermoanaerobaculaceae bacterium]